MSKYVQFTATQWIILPLKTVFYQLGMLYIMYTYKGDSSSKVNRNKHMKCIWLLTSAFLECSVLFCHFGDIKDNIYYKDLALLYTIRGWVHLGIFTLLKTRMSWAFCHKLRWTKPLNGRGNVSLNIATQAKEILHFRKKLTNRCRLIIELTKPNLEYSWSGLFVAWKLLQDFFKSFCPS